MHNYSIIACISTVCEAGYGDENGNGTCTECPIGSYRSGLGNDSCILCNLGKTTNASGSTNVSECGQYCCPCGIDFDDCPFAIESRHILFK